jgi:hypothetical protein
MTDKQMAVFHLTTGHVVGVMTAGRQVPTADQATGGEHISVRIPGDRVVHVPAERLSRLVTRVDDDVLRRWTEYRVDDATALVAFAGPLKPANNPQSKPFGTVLSVWDGPGGPEVAEETLDQNGNLPQPAPPPGATHRLVAIEGEPLMYAP